ncbi:MAG: type II secretion system protein, partial [bacterium]
MRPRDRSLKSGFTLVETIISMSILVFLILALFTIMTSNLTALFNSKSRSIALNLAQEKIENLKNLSYDNLATQGGNIYPAGSIVDDEVIIRNNLRFRIHTDIRYIDNPYDGNALGTIPNKPTDLYSYDYKKATVEIYTATGTTKLAVLSTDVAAKAAETSSNTGVLIIRVIDASGSPVSNATVQVTNTNPNPDV